VVAPDAESFIEEVQGHNALLFEFQDMRGVRSIVEFRLTGFATASRGVSRACRWEEKAKARMANADRAKRKREADQRAERDSIAEAEREEARIAAAAKAFDSAWAAATPGDQLDVRPKVISGDGADGHLSVKGVLGGMATIKFVVDANGRVSAVRIADNTDPLFARAAALAVGARTYSPATRLGKAVPARMQQSLVTP